MLPFLSAQLLFLSAVTPMQHGHHAMDRPGRVTEAAPAISPIPVAAGQAAFEAIREIVGILQSDPSTNWREVDIDRLRDHLVDMDAVLLRARVTNIPLKNGMRFLIEGDGPVGDSIKTIAMAHARMADGADGLTVTAAETPSGAAMTIVADDPSAIERVKALGFFGLLTADDHHHQHHLLMAKGSMSH